MMLNTLFSNNPHSISAAVLECVQSVLEFQHTPSETARPLLLGVINGLADILNNNMEVQRRSLLNGVVGPLYQLVLSTTDDGIGLAAARLMFSIYKHSTRHGARLIPFEGIHGLSAEDRTLDEAELREWLNAQRNPPEQS